MRLQDQTIVGWPPPEEEAPGEWRERARLECRRPIAVYSRRRPVSADPTFPLPPNFCAGHSQQWHQEAAHPARRQREEDVNVYLSNRVFRSGTLWRFSSCDAAAATVRTCGSTITGIHFSTAPPTATTSATESRFRPAPEPKPVGCLLLAIRYHPDHPDA